MYTPTTCYYYYYYLFTILITKPLSEFENQILEISVPTTRRGMARRHGSINTFYFNNAATGTITREYVFRQDHRFSLVKRFSDGIVISSKSR